jgi:V8-like Glu-specific endopeptidase
MELEIMIKEYNLLQVYNKYPNRSFSSYDTIPLELLSPMKTYDFQEIKEMYLDLNKWATSQFNPPISKLEAFQYPGSPQKVKFTFDENTLLASINLELLKRDWNPKQSPTDRVDENIILQNYTDYELLGIASMIEAKKYNEYLFDVNNDITNDDELLSKWSLVKPNIKSSNYPSINKPERVTPFGTSPVISGDDDKDKFVTGNDGRIDFGIAFQKYNAIYNLPNENASDQNTNGKIITEEQFMQGKSIAALIKKNRMKLGKDDNYHIKLTERKSICSTVLFSDQNTAVTGTAFLISQNVLATVSHVGKYTDFYCVFDYVSNKDDSKSLEKIIPKNCVYEIESEILKENEIISNSRLKLLKLKTIVSDDREPLYFDSTPISKAKTPLYSIGFPEGLPMKFLLDAFLMTTPDKYGLFQVDIDSFPGDSGSPVFDSYTNLVIGIIEDHPDADVEDYADGFTWVKGRKIPCHIAKKYEIKDVSGIRCHEITKLYNLLNSEGIITY